MPDLGPYLAKRPRARPRAPARLGAVGLPKVPDLSQSQLRPLMHLQQTIAGVAGEAFSLADRTLQAQDAAKLAQAEGALTEQLGLAYNSLVTDQAVDPFEYGSRLQATRAELIQTLGQDLGGRVQGTWQGRAARATDGLIIKADFQGKTEGVSRAKSTLETTTDQLVRAQVAEPDPRQQAVIQQQIADLHAGYVSSGILSPQDAQSRLLKLADTRAVYTTQAAIRADPDAALAQLEQGPAANPSLPPEMLTKLTDEARRVQSERFHAAEAREAKVRRDTLEAQKITEAESFGAMQSGKLNRAGLDHLRDSRQISPQGYETLLRYADTKAREDRSEARAAASLGLQRQAAGYRSTEAQLSILATMGQLDQRGIIDFARSRNLPPEAIDGAIGKAQAYQNSQKSEFRSQQSQAEQMLTKAFPRTAFDAIEPIAQPTFNAALDELTSRSKAFGGTEDPIAVVREIIPKYQASISMDVTTQIEGLQARLKYASPDALEAARGSIPGTFYEDQRKLFKQIEDTAQRLLPPPAKPVERGYLGTAWDWWMKPAGGGRSAPRETP